MLISLPAVMVTSSDFSLAPIRLVVLPEVREMSPLAVRLAILLVRDSEPLVEVFEVVEPDFQLCDSEYEVSWEAWTVMLFWAVAARFSEVVRLEPVMVMLLPEDRLTEPEELMLEARFVSVSVMLVPPFSELPHEDSEWLWSFRVSMVMLLLAVMERFPEDELGKSLVAVTLAAKLVKSFAATISIFPPFNEAFCTRFE